MLLVLSMRTAYEGGWMLLSTDTTLPAALLPSLSRYHSLQNHGRFISHPDSPRSIQGLPNMPTDVDFIYFFLGSVY